MKRLGLLLVAVVTAFVFGAVAASTSFAQEKKPERKIEKFGEDQRAKEWKGK